MFNCIHLSSYAFREHVWTLIHAAHNRHPTAPSPSIFYLYTIWMTFWLTLYPVLERSFLLLLMSHTSASSISLLFIRTLRLEGQGCEWAHCPWGGNIHKGAFWGTFWGAFWGTLSGFVLFSACRLKMLKTGKHPDCDLNREVFLLYLHTLLSLYLGTKLWFRFFPSGEIFQRELRLETQIKPRDWFSSLIID